MATRKPQRKTKETNPFSQEEILSRLVDMTREAGQAARGLREVQCLEGDPG